MITEKEIQSTQLSATKKDFYQIWNELLETAGKLSERWDPTSTNESDPGIVLLKVLSALGDHLNYNIDKNILEAFMPSAAQEESMRKLCEMMGYSMSYYRSATTDLTIYYAGDADDWADSNGTGWSNTETLILPAFTQITNTDQDIVYTTTEAAVFTKEDSLKTVPCIEGTLSYCEEDNNSTVTLDNLDDNNRYYLPVQQVAENGIFIYNISDSSLSDKWEQVDNLNTQQLETKVYKFGYDSKEFLPYVEFPSDVSSLIEDGLCIAYISTNGLNGNVSVKTLTSFETPSEWALEDSATNNYNQTGVEHTSDDFVCYNASAATNGADKESLDSAYNSFKKTVGTFDTLVTCRDYMNKIYQLTVSETDTTPLVSNSVVSDIRDDINRAITICTFDGNGIKYVDKSLTENVAQTIAGASNISVNGTSVSNGTLTFTSAVDKIDHFDLMLYPFKTVTGLNTKTEYDASFKYAGESTADDVIDAIADYKTISHAINLPEDDEIMCVKIYMRLNAKITTANKVNSVEWAAILANIKEAIYENFNCRQIDFGDEIPFDEILDVIQNADTNIKNVSLEDPDLYTAFLTADGKEYLFQTEDNGVTDEEIKQKKASGEKLTTSYSVSQKKEKAKELYNKLAIRNVLAGRVELFNYDTDFSTTVAESKNENYYLVYPQTSDDSIIKLLPKLTVYSGQDEYELKENQIIRFRAPNFNTSVTYPAYVNYFFHGSETATAETAAKAATFVDLKTFLTADRTVTDAAGTTINYPAERFTNFINYRAAKSTQNISSGTFDALTASYGVAFYQVSLYQADAAADITSDCYYIPTAETTSAGISTISGNSFDGNVYPIDSTYDSTNNTLKVCDSYPDSTRYTDVNVSSEKSAEKSLTVDTNKVFTSNSSKARSTTTTFTYYKPYISTDTAPTGTYYIYPLDSSTWTIFHKWIQQYVDFQTGYDDDIPKRNGLYRKYATNFSYLPGKLIDTEPSKYQLLTSWYSTTTPLTSCYVQETHLSDADATIDDSGEVKNYGSTKDGLGEDATYSTLTANAEYQLKAGEFLCVNYTESTSEVDEDSTDASASTLSTTSEVVNVYYGEGTIIRPNFALMDSATKNNSTSYAKTSGYDFSSELGSDYTNVVPGMFSLGSDEQIEIREQVSVYVYDATNTKSSGTNPVYVYFNINGSEEDRLTFLPATRGSSRILEEGEYFWYTDKNKQTLTYCGEGTEVFNYTGQTIAKSEDDDVSTEDILTNGISVVPWIRLTGLFMTEAEKPTNEDKYIRWDEYQYVELVEGDKLYAAGGSTATTIAYDLTTDEWTQISYASYESSGEAGELVPFSVYDADGNAIGWEAKALLAVSMNSDYSQTLTSEDKSYSEKIRACYSGYDENNGQTYQDFENVTLKSNYSISSSSEEIDTTYSLYDEDDTLTEEVSDFELKAFDSNTLYTNESTDQPDQLTLNNVGTGLTSFSFEKYDETKTSGKPFAKLYSTLPQALTTQIAYENVTEGSNFFGKAMKTPKEYSISATITGSSVVSSASGMANAADFGFLVWYNKTETSTDFLTCCAHYDDGGKEIASFILSGEIGGEPVSKTLAGWTGNYASPADGFDLSVDVSIADDAATFGVTASCVRYTDGTTATYEGTADVFGVSTGTSALGLYSVGEKTYYTDTKISPVSSIDGNWANVTEGNEPTTEITTVADPDKRKFNLFMIYYDTSTTDKDGCAYMTVVPTSGTDTDQQFAYIYNYQVDGKDSWWDGYTDSMAVKDEDGNTTYTCIKYYLKPGINVIKLNAAADGTIAEGLTLQFYPGTETTDILIFSQLDTITENLDGDDTDLGLNLSLLGYSYLKSDDSDETQKATAKQLLAAINELDPDHEFYYNSMSDSSLEIDINEAAGEKLSTESVWFDYNNVNNKFVIAEIDSDYLDTGITLARTSSK